MKWVRNNIKNLKEYKVENNFYRIKLDANEGENIFFKDFNSVDMEFLKDINRYPDNNTEILGEEIGKYLGVKADNIIAGNGSSEIIELVMKTFIGNNDKILSFVPTFSMYSIFAKIYGGEFIGVGGQGSCTNAVIPKEDFSLNIDILIEKAKKINPKLILICNPNNPTGYLIPKESIIRLLESVESIVVVDEAYIEFAEGSMVDEIENYENLIILRTFSKALGLAGLRLGYMIANTEITNMVSKVKSPYSLNTLSQAFGIMALKNISLINTYVQNVNLEREKLYKILKEFGFKVYPSSTNFILFYSQIRDLGEKLKNDGVLIRSFSGDLENYYRVSIGSVYENNEFIKSLKEILKNEKI